MRVAIIDENYHVRFGLRTVLELNDDFLVVGEGATGQEALEICEQFQPDVLLMDIKLPGMDGLSASEMISQRYPAIRIIILNLYVDSSVVQQLPPTGIADILAKQFTIDELLNTLAETPLRRAG
jgi:DNA-binding NarL/FixJ family response regulator